MFKRKPRDEWNNKGRCNRCRRQSYYSKPCKASLERIGAPKFSKARQIIMAGRPKGW